MAVTGTIYRVHFDRPTGTSAITSIGPVTWTVAWPRTVLAPAPAS